MPIYLEYDKIDGSVKRVLTAETLPINVAYLAYQEIPDSVEIDTSLHINEIIQKIINVKNEQKIVNVQNISKIDEPEIIEV